MGSGSSSSSPETRPGPKPDITQNRNIVKISIYGNGKVAQGVLFGTSHVFTVLQTAANIFILLEVERCDNGKINIRMETDGSLDGVIRKRLNTEAQALLWRSENVNALPSRVQRIIDQYHDHVYHATRRSCRTFVDAVCAACGASIRCNMPDEWWALW